MKKKICLILICVVVCAIFLACEPACKHDYGEWETYKAATCHSTGVKIRTCFGCGKIDKVIAQKKSHNMQLVYYEENNCLRCRFWAECIECFEDEYVIADDKAYGNHVYDVNNVCEFCDSVYVPTGDEYFSFNSVGVDGVDTYIIKSVKTDNLPANLVIPNTYKGLPVSAIASNAFHRTNIESLTIPNNITTIENSAFSSCKNLRTISMGSNVKAIGDRAFENCVSLTDLKMSNSVQTLGDQAFGSCSALTKIVIPNCTVSIGLNVFESCSSLTSIEVERYNGSYMSMDGNLYAKDGADFLAYAGGKTDEEFEVPHGVKVIKSYAFNNCKNLKKITLSDSVETIKSYAFEYCTGLTDIIIGKNVRFIGESAFWACTELASAVFRTPWGWRTDNLGFTVTFTELYDSQAAAEFLKKYWTSSWTRGSVDE